MAGLPGVNVALPARASQTVAQGLVRSTNAIGASLLTSGFFIALVTATYVLIRKGITAWRKNRLLAQVGNSSADGLAIGYAQRAYTAMISGYAWWNDIIGDGTDEEALYQVAREMHAHQVPFALVAGKYNTLYNRDLLADLTSELSSAELQKFQAALSSGLGGLGRLPTPRTLLYTTRPTTVYTISPDERLLPLGPVAARTRLGEHTHTLLGRDGQAWHGFDYGGQVRLLPAATVGQISY